LHQAVIAPADHARIAAAFALDDTAHEIFRHAFRRGMTLDHGVELAVGRDRGAVTGLRRVERRPQGKRERAESDFADHGISEFWGRLVAGPERVAAKSGDFVTQNRGGVEGLPMYRARDPMEFCRPRRRERAPAFSVFDSDAYLIGRRATRAPCRRNREPIRRANSCSSTSSMRMARSARTGECRLKSSAA